MNESVEEAGAERMIASVRTSLSLLGMSQNAATAFAWFLGSLETQNWVEKSFRLPKKVILGLADLEAAGMVQYVRSLPTEDGGDVVLEKPRWYLLETEVNLGIVARALEAAQVEEQPKVVLN